jgi:molecular chaperone GrpE
LTKRERKDIYEPDPAEQAATAEPAIGQLKQQLNEEKEKAEKFKENWQRAEADFSNYKKRAEQEKSEIGTNVCSALILNLLPIIDDFRRAFDSLPAELEDQDWTEGMRLIYRKLESIMESQGLCGIECVGKCFDPHYHEAIAHVEGEEGIVLGEAQKGYTFRDKVLRPSQVVVGKGKEESNTDE